MRATLAIGRTCLRQTFIRVRPAARSRIIQFALKRSYGGRGNGFFWSSSKRPGLLLAAAASLSPVVFVQLSEEDNGGTEQTAESRMLEASREEIKKKVGDDVHGFQRIRHSVALFLDVYIWEPLCTGLRFLHLTVIFVPVLIAVPMIWFGARDPERDNERSGSLLWYMFLVKSMEHAGPAFIKVNPHPNSPLY